MSREYPAYPLPGVLAVVERDGRFLLARRANDPLRGRWGFPGGLIETGESVAEAVRRELMEETGIDAEPGPAIDVFDVVERDSEGGVRIHFILIAVTCRWLSGEGEAGDDADQIGWFLPDEIAAPGFHGIPDLARLVGLARRMIENGGIAR